MSSANVRIGGAGRERENGNALAQIFERELGTAESLAWRLYVGCGITTESQAMRQRFGRRSHGMETDLTIAAWFDPPLTRVLTVKGELRAVRFHSLCAAIEVKGLPAYALSSLTPYVVYDDGTTVYPAEQAQASGTALGTMLRERDLKVWVDACVWLRANDQEELRTYANGILAVFFGGDATLDDVLTAVVNGEREPRYSMGRPDDRASIDAIGDLIAPLQYDQVPRPERLRQVLQSAAPPPIATAVRRPTYSSSAAPQPWSGPSHYVVHPTFVPRTRTASHFAPRVPIWPFVAAALVLAVYIALGRLGGHPKRVVHVPHVARHAHVVVPPRRWRPHPVAVHHSKAAIAAALSRLGGGASKSHGSAHTASAISTLPGMR